MSNDIFDAENRHQHYLERFKTGEVNTLSAFLKKVEESLILQLSKSNTFTSRKRIKAILDRIKKDAEFFLTEYVQQLQLDLDDFGAAEAEFTATALANDVGLETTVPSAGQVATAARARPFNSRLLSETLKDFPKEQARFIRNSVATGFAEGRTNQQIIRDVVGTSELKFKDGSMQVTRNTAARMVRTSIQHTATVAKEAVYKANSKIVKKYAWVSTLDSRTSPTCKKRDQQVYVVGKGPLPPAHPNCRSTTVPVFKGETQDVDGVEKLDLKTGTRSSKGLEGGKQTSVKNDYNSWLERQPKQFQIDALGKSRAELFRKGGLTVDKFVDRLDRPLTLEQLKNTFPTAWGKANLT